MHSLSDPIVMLRMTIGLLRQRPPGWTKLSPPPSNAGDSIPYYKKCRRFHVSVDRVANHPSNVATRVANTELRHTFHARAVVHNQQQTSTITSFPSTNLAPSPNDDFPPPSPFHRLDNLEIIDNLERLLSGNREGQARFFFEARLLCFLSTLFEPP